jgi:hypothetical protein
MMVKRKQGRGAPASLSFHISGTVGIRYARLQNRSLTALQYADVKEFRCTRDLLVAPT